MMTALHWIQHLQLQPHPEGGWYAENYRSAVCVPGDALPEAFGSARSVATSIYFLLESGQRSHFHRLRSDELWFFHAGSPLRVHIIDSAGVYAEIMLGIDSNTLPQCIIPAATWFAAEPIEESYSLVGCVVAPGFEFEDFELAARADLLQAYPAHADLITRFTVDAPG